jgi:uncharacterized protein (TIGR00730 family)
LKNSDRKIDISERLFLDGPRSRWKEFIFSIKVLFQFIKGFRNFHFLGPCATVFGSARFKEAHPYYVLTQNMGYELVKIGFTVMTGGGPGLMEAANRGAKEANGRSVGCNIVLKTEQKPNKYLDKWVEIHFFFVRKILLFKYSFVFVVMPGGFGTLDEFFEALTLIQTQKSKKFPIVVMGKQYHRQLINHINYMEKIKTISQEDKELFLFTDDVEEAIKHIKIYAIKKFNLSKKKAYIPFRILGENK